MASTAVSNPAVNNSDSSLLRRKKKKKIPNQNQNLRNQAQAAQTEWKSDTQQQAYSSKLLQALRRVRITGGAAPKGGRAVREAADRVLAVAAKGRTRWSRSILTNRIKLKFMKNSASHKRHRVTVTTGNSRWQKKRRVSILRLKTKNLPAFQRKARVLGRLVPGCRKQPLPVILEEATDYIAALEMQVRAMTALTQLLSGASSSSSSFSSSASSSSSSSVNALNQLGSSRHPPAS